MTKNGLLCGKLFQTEVAAAEKALPPMVARLVREMTSAACVLDMRVSWSKQPIRWSDRSGGWADFSGHNSPCIGL